MAFQIPPQIQIVSTGVAGQISGVKVCVYGPANAGKTRLCATAPNPIIFSAERGLLSLRKFNLPCIQIETLSQLTDAHDWALGSNEARQFETFCLDSGSEIAEQVLENERTKSKDGRQYWQATATEVLRIFRNFRNFAHKHVYITAKQEYEKDGVDGRLLYRPFMPGKALSQALPYLFDEMFRLVVVEQNGQPFRWLRTSPDFQTEAKDRSGALAIWEPPDLSAIFHKILNG